MISPFEPSVHRLPRPLGEHRRDSRRRLCGADDQRHPDQGRPIAVGTSAESFVAWPLKSLPMRVVPGRPSSQSGCSSGLIAGTFTGNYEWRHWRFRAGHSLRSHRGAPGKAVDRIRGLFHMLSYAEIGAAACSPGRWLAILRGQPSSLPRFQQRRASSLWKS